MTTVRAVTEVRVRRLSCAGLGLAVAAVFSTSFAAQSPPVAPGTVFHSPGGITLRLLVDDTTLGPEAAVGEMTLPAHFDSGDHRHGAIELLYVLSGQLTHVVNGKSEVLPPGATGVVKLGDTVRHVTGAEPVKVLVIWVPGAEAHRVVAGWRRDGNPGPGSMSRRP